MPIPSIVAANVRPVLDSKLDADDGLRGPAGETLGAALHAVGTARGLSVNYPNLLQTWVDQDVGDRRLLVRWSDLKPQARTSGHRWIAVRLSTKKEFGAWATPPVGGGRQTVIGVDLGMGPPPANPTGFYAEDPTLLEDVWKFALRFAGTTPATNPSWAALSNWLHLQVRHDAVIFHLRAQRVDATRLGEALDLLERVATYGETHDAELSTRLGTAHAVKLARWGQLFAAVVMVAMVIAILWAASRC